MSRRARDIRYPDLTIGPFELQPSNIGRSFRYPPLSKVAKESQPTPANADRDRVKKVLAFINLASERGGRSLLKLEASGNIPELALRLLAAHSERWRAAEFSCDVSNFHHLASAKGKLPSLQYLKLNASGKALETMDIFGVTPNLTSLTISGALIPRNGQTIPPSTPLLHCYRSKAGGSLDGAVLGVGLVTSNTFGHCIEAFDAMLAGLTLPHLQRLTLWIHRVQYPEFRLPWRHAEFLAFSMRSSFHTHLKALHLPHVLITEKELVECLLLQPLLQQLNISDHQRVKYSSEDHILMTSSFFQSLIRTADSMCLVPQLRSLVCHSLLRFDDAVYLKFLLSRLEKGCTFETELFWFPLHSRELCPDVMTQIQELRAQRQLAFSFDEWDYEA
ncbi:hypothetical protein DFH08DRAFT_1040089 [Mycena albidolilacea]|uniref:Uncharacterized protein n=1 Tax=Mycena albidolilacea TaxID=1033008 RepID=A0AAD6ZCG3_9AGAR|nr:hypothetical protein DFH08DRAFT_1040089 [Mycena albidolilacea]